MGYQSVEMCSPPGYESSGFGPLMKMTAKEMKKIINDAGLYWKVLTMEWMNSETTLMSVLNLQKNRDRSR